MEKAGRRFGSSVSDLQAFTYEKVIPPARLPCSRGMILYCRFPRGEALVLRDILAAGQRIPRQTGREKPQLPVNQRNLAYNTKRL